MLKIKTLLSKVIEYSKEHKAVAAVAVLIIIGGGYWVHKAFANKDTETKYFMTKVELGDISTTVSGSGQVAASSQIDLKPKTSGELTYIGVKAGQEVGKGKSLFSINAQDANKAVRDATLALQVAQFDLETAQKDYTQTKKSQSLSLNNELTTLNSVVTAVPDSNNSNTNIINISGAYNSSIQGRYTLETYSCQAGVCLKYSGIESDTASIYTNIPIKLGTRGLYVTFTTIPYVNEKWYIDVPSPQSTSYLSNLKSYTEKTDSSEDVIESAAENVTAKELSLKQRQNALTDAKEALADFYVPALFSGQISSVPVQLGEQVSPSTVLATLITNQKIAQISLNEVDVAKLKVGDAATLTFDAVPDLKIDGQVSEIDISGTENQGVVTYEVKIAFDSSDSRIKPGMSVDADIVTDTKTNVLIVPNSAVKNVRGRNFVETFDPLPSAASTTLRMGFTSSVAPVQIPVEIGIANDTSTEIISGLKEADEVVARSVATVATTAATPAAPSLFGGGTRTGGGGATRITAGAAR